MGMARGDRDARCEAQQGILQPGGPRAIGSHREELHMGTGPSSVDFSVPPAPESRALTPSPKKSTELGPARSHDHALRPSIARFAIAPVSFCPYAPRRETGM